MPLQRQILLSFYSSFILPTQNLEDRANPILSMTKRHVSVEGVGDLWSIVHAERQTLVSDDNRRSMFVRCLSVALSSPENLFISFGGQSRHRLESRFHPRHVCYNNQTAIYHGTVASSCCHGLVNNEYP
jgi:hypothetical protein